MGKKTPTYKEMLDRALGESARLDSDLRQDWIMLYRNISDVFTLMEETYDGKISNVVANLQGLSIENRITYFDDLLGKLPRLEFIRSLFYTLSHEIGNKRRREYPFEQFLRETHPEITCKEELLNTESPQIVVNEYTAELNRRYLDIQAESDVRLAFYAPFLHADDILSKLIVKYKQELEIQIKSKKHETSGNKTGEPISLVKKINWLPATNEELRTILLSAKGNLLNYNDLEAVFSGHEDLSLCGSNKYEDALLFFYVLAKAEKIKILNQWASTIAKAFNLDRQTVQNENRELWDIFEKEKINIIDDHEGKTEKIEKFLERVKYFEKLFFPT